MSGDGAKISRVSNYIAVVFDGITQIGAVNFVIITSFTGYDYRIQ